MPLDFEQIVSDSVAVAKTELGSAWKKVKPYADHEFRQFAENIDFLTQLYVQGKIDEAELKGRLEYQKLALSNVLLTIKGIGLSAAQNTVNAVLKIVAKAVSIVLKVVLPV